MSDYFNKDPKQSAGRSTGANPWQQDPFAAYDDPAYQPEAPDAAAERLLPHVNLFTYGNEVIQHDNAALTSYGLLHREDYQPMQTQVQERFEMDMQ